MQDGLPGSIACPARTQWLRLLWQAVAATSMLLGLGCRGPMPAIEGIPLGEPLALDAVRVVETMNLYAGVRQDRRALRGTARVALSGPDFKLDRPQRIVVERPDRLRFEILGLFDQLAAVLAADGAEYGFYDASSGEISRGRVSPALLWELTKIDLTTEEVVGLLLGAPDPEAGTELLGAWLEPSGRLGLGFAWPESAGEPAARAIGASGGQIFLFDVEGRLVELRALEEGGSIRYRAYFEAHELLEGSSDDASARGGGVIFPKRITLESPIMGSMARFDWKRVMLAGELSDRFFRIPEPRRAKRAN